MFLVVILIILLIINVLDAKKVSIIYSSKGEDGKTYLRANLTGSLRNGDEYVLDIDYFSKANFPGKSSSPYSVFMYFLCFGIRQFISSNVQPQFNLSHSDNRGNSSEEIVTQPQIGCRQLRTPKKSQQIHDFIVVNTQIGSSLLLAALIVFGKIILPPMVPVLLSANIFLRSTVQKINDLNNEFHHKTFPNILRTEFNDAKPTDISNVFAQQISLYLNCIYEIKPLTATVLNQTVFLDTSTVQASDIYINRDTFNFEVLGSPQNLLLQKYSPNRSTQKINSKAG